MKCSYPYSVYTTAYKTKAITVFSRSAPTDRNNSHAGSPVPHFLSRIQKSFSILKSTVDTRRERFTIICRPSGQTICDPRDTFSFSSLAVPLFFIYGTYTGRNTARDSSAKHTCSAYTFHTCKRYACP